MSDRLAEIKARLEAATPGPWKVQHDSDGDEERYEVWPSRIVTEDETGVVIDFGDDPHDDDAALVAHAPADLGYLLDALAAMTERAERAEAVLHDLDTHPTPASKDGRCWFCAGGLGHGPDGHRDGCVWVRARLLAMAEHPS